MYLEQRYRKFYACHDIPPDVQEALGEPGKPRRRFVKSLDTADLATAKVRAALLEAQWRLAIERARKPGDFEAEATWWRKAILGAKTAEERTFATQQAIEEAHDAGGFISGDPEAEVDPTVQRFVSIAMGDLVKLDAHLDEYLKTLAGRNESKTIDMQRSIIKKFAAEFPYVADVQRKAVQGWVNRQAQEGKAVGTIRHSLSKLRGYWKYLVAVSAAPEDSAPFDKLSLVAAPKNSKADERKPFSAADVLRLLGEARDRKDAPLADLIELGMWTGARLEELCALPVGKVNLKDRYIEIADAKTKAGWRQVPVHSKLAPTMERLIGARTDGYVLSGLSRNKYGDRSNAIGKRFGSLKRALGFGEDRVFHSIRKTVATLLEDAGVPENVSADILGHEKPTMTYGLYSGGTSLKTKQAAIEKLDYGV